MLCLECIFFSLLQMLLFFCFAGLILKKLLHVGNSLKVLHVFVVFLRCDWKWPETQCGWHMYIYPMFVLLILVMGDENNDHFAIKIVILKLLLSSEIGLLFSWNTDFFETCILLCCKIMALLKNISPLNVYYKLRHFKSHEQHLV